MCKNLLALTLLIITITAQLDSLKNQTCTELITAMVQNIMNSNFSALPLPSIMYSGISTNNPGQKYECEEKSFPKNFTYFLIDWKNTTNNIDIFTGICVPDICKKQDIELGLRVLQIKEGVVYDYPKNESSNGLLITSCVFVSIWAAVLVVWSIYRSCKEPSYNELIKKHQEKVEEDESVNDLVQHKKKEDFKLFDFYEGYCKIFKRSSSKNPLGAILFLAALSLTFSTEFSYRQKIAANQPGALKWFNSLGGVLFCNFQISYSIVMLVLGVSLARSLHNLSNFHQIGKLFFTQLLTKWGILVLTTMAGYVLLSLTDEPLSKLWNTSYGQDCPSTMYQMWFLFRTLTFDCKVCLQWFWILQTDILLTLISAPFFIIFKNKKSFGLLLLGMLIFTSLIVGYAILSDKNIIFEPYKLFNMSKDFTISYQSNAIVRAAPYYLGLIFGLLVSEANEKHERQQKRWWKAIRNSSQIQIALQIGGLALMLINYLLIIPYLEIAQAGDARQSARLYLLFNTLSYLIGFCVFILPSLIKAEGKLTTIINKILGWELWTSLERMSVGFLLWGPVVIGFTTFSMQNSIYYDFETVFVYFLGDAVIIYILTLVACSAIDQQVTVLVKSLQSKLFGHDSRHSVIVLED